MNVRAWGANLNVRHQAGGHPTTHALAEFEYCVIKPLVKPGSDVVQRYRVMQIAEP